MSPCPCTVGCSVVLLYTLLELTRIYGVKVNAASIGVLCNMLLPPPCISDGDDWYIFQQDTVSAPAAHRARTSYRGFLPGKRNARVHFAAIVASKFAVCKSGGLLQQRVCREHTAREGVQNTHHWSWRPQTSYQSVPSGPSSWITPTLLLQLCVSDVVVFQLVSRRTADGGHFEHCF